jgi:hypothetical protein
MKYTWWLFSGLAFIATLILLAIGWLAFSDLGGAHNIGAFHGIAFLSSGEGRLIMISRAFRTGTFSPHYSTLALLVSLLPLGWVAAWPIRRQFARHRIRRGFPVGT